jgi:hypothetical protein
MDFFLSKEEFAGNDYRSEVMGFDPFFKHD